MCKGGGRTEISGERNGRKVVWQRIAKFRLGNKVMEGKYWEEENRRMCRLCGRLGSMFERNARAGMREEVVGKKRVRGSWEGEEVGERRMREVEEERRMRWKGKGECE